MGKLSHSPTPLQKSSSQWPIHLNSRRQIAGGCWGVFSAEASQKIFGSNFAYIASIATVESADMESVNL
jgi:hypothetical protein